jgi:hypothetical protein
MFESGPGSRSTFEQIRRNSIRCSVNTQREYGTNTRVWLVRNAQSSAKSDTIATIETDGGSQMKKLYLLTALAGVMIPMVAAAQSAFEGTWKFDTNKVDFPKKPDVYVLQNGTYECKTCTPPYKIKADGTD